METPVLLGIVHEAASVDDTSPYACKVGGQPAWYDSMPKLSKPLICPKCKEPLYLVAQVYAPAEMDRTLYVFGCNSIDCVDTSGSWRVIRDQAKAKVEEKAVESLTAQVKGLEVGWGDGDDSDWSDEESNLASDDVDLEQLLQQRDAAMNHRTSPKAKDNTLKQKAPTTTTVSNGDAFPSLLLDVTEEPYEDHTRAKDFAYEKSLLEQYMASEEEEKSEDVSQLKELLKNPAQSSSSKGSSEAYEKTPAHQRYFIKFQNRVSRSPLQCLRYDYGGEPLWPTAPPDSKISQCQCGRKKVFEMQLTPTLLYFLHVDEVAKAKSAESKGGMDWLGIVVYSCPESCDRSKEESVIVLPSS